MHFVRHHRFAIARAAEDYPSFAFALFKAETLRLSLFDYRSNIETQAPTEGVAFVFAGRVYFATEEKRIDYILRTITLRIHCMPLKPLYGLNTLNPKIANYLVFG